MFQKFKSDIMAYFSNGPKVFFIAVLICMCGVMGLLSMEKTVNIVVDGQEQSVITFKSSVSDILKKNDIAIGPKDIVEPALDSKIKSGDTINIEKAVNIVLKMDGETKTILTNADSIGEFLKEEGVVLGKEDKISPSKEEHIKDKLNIAVTRVNTVMEKKTEPIEFATEIKKDNSLKEGSKKVVQEGSAGEKEINTKVVYKDGEEVSREVVGEKVVKEPKNKVVAMGTMKEVKLSRGGEAKLSRGGNVNYGSKYRMRATGYSETFKNTGKNPGDKGYGVTASGSRVKRDPNGYSTVAVDPRVIPLGTKLYVEGYGYAVAADTGGAINGNRIDLYFTSDAQATNWGVRYVDVYVVKK